MTTADSKRITIEDVARQAGVSVATVSRALRDLPNVAPSTRSRVREVARELHYVADPTAARLAGGGTSAVAVAVPAVHRWYFAGVVAGIEQVLRQQGLDLLLYCVAGEVDRRRFFQGRGAWWRRGDGLVLVGVLLEQHDAERIAAHGPAIATVGVRHRQFSSVTIDEEAGAAAAVGHLVARGHRRIGLIGGERAGRLDPPGLRQRRLGYRRALQRVGVDPDPDLEVPAGSSVDAGRAAMARLLALPRPPTAVFATTDELAFGALDELHRRRLAAPRDVAVAGFDDHELAGVLGLTTVRQDVARLGAEAARLVLAALRGAAAPQHVAAGTTLVVRSST